MIIEVERYYLSSGILSRVMINTDYIQTIEGITEDANPANTRVVMEGTNKDPHIFYVTETYQQMRTKIMGRRKK